MKRLKYFIVAVTIILIAGIGIATYSKRSAYEVPVNLTAEQRAAYEAIIEQMDKKIKEVKPPEKPDIDFFVEKAKYQEYLGRYSSAIDTLLDAFRYYENSVPAWNNLGKLYDKVGDYKSALVFYNKLINLFNQERYYLEAAWDYFRLGKIKEAQEAYGKFAQFTGGSDEDLYKLLYKGKSQ